MDDHNLDEVKKDSEIDKSKLPTDADHPGEEISNENKIIEGDKVMGVEPSPPAAPAHKRNYVLIIVVIIVVIVGFIWAMRGCDKSFKQDVASVNTEIINDHI